MDVQSGGSNTSEYVSSLVSQTESSLPSPAEGQLFKLVRPICVEVMRKPTCENLHQLATILHDVPADIARTQLIEYIIFPLSMHLKMIDKLRQEVQIALYNCLLIILTKWGITSFLLFLELFHRFNVALGSKVEPTKLNADLPEDVLQPLTSCLFELLTTSLSFHFQELYTSKYVASIGHCIFMVLQIITDNTTVSLRMTALNILHELISICFGSIEAGHHIFKFLPGIASGLRKVCSLKVGRRHNKLITKALSVLQVAVMVSAKSEAKDALQVADMNLSTVFQQISDSFVVCEDEQIQQSIMEFSMDLIEPISMKMPICSEIIWNNVFILASNMNNLVSERCQQFILSSKLQSDLSNPETVVNLIRRALGLLKTHDETGSVLLLKRIASSLFLVSMPPKELRLFLSALLETVRLSFVESIANRSLEIELELKKSNPIRKVCSCVCSNMTLATELEDILNELSELLKDVNSTESISTCRSASLVFIINSVISSCSESSSSSSVFSFNCIRRSLESNEVCATVSTYVDCLNAKTEAINEGRLKMSVIDNSQSKIVTPKFELSKAIYNSFILEGLGILLSIDPQSIQPYILPDIVYVLLEHAGRSDFSFLPTTAMETLQRVSPSSSMEEILTQNMDLILNELSTKIKLTPKEFSPRCPDAVIFLAKYFDFSNSGFVEFIEEIFFQSNNQYIEEQGMGLDMFAKLFYAIISSLCLHWQKQQSIAKKELQDKNMVLAVKVNSIFERLMEYQNSVGMSIKDTSVETSEALNTEAPSEHDSTETEYDEKLPANPSLALRICQRVLHYLPHEQRTTKLLAMDILVKGLQVLQSYENILLPLAHQIWDYLVPRFEEADYVIVRKSFELLLTLCSASKTFLKKRTLTEIFPKLATLLQKLGEESRQIKDKNRVYYTSTQAYKLQLCVLEGLAELCTAIEILECDINNVADGCLLYLAPDQHKNLREASKKLLQQLARTTYGSTIWLKLIAQGLAHDSLALPEEPPHQSFKAIPSSLLVSYSKHRSKN